MGSKRLQKELSKIRNSNLNDSFKMENVSDNFHEWTVILQPSTAPYNKALFRAHVMFPEEYPFKPPIIKMVTPIYHPNIDENGNPCLPITTPEYWKPSLRVEEVLNALVALINSPEVDHPLRPDVAEQYVKNPKKFRKIAEEWCVKYAEIR